MPIKTKNISKIGILITTLFMFNLTTIAQEKDLENLILEMDAEFWKGYNNCDIKLMNKYLAEDIEFYHDKGGIELGSKMLNEGIKNGLCETGSNKIRREAIAETIAVYPLMDSNKIYGAILSGEHLFYMQHEDSESLDGQAKFNHLWLLKDGKWKMHRVLSYDHRAPEYVSKTKQVSLSKQQLEKFAGTYELPSKDLITVEVKEDHLKLVSNGKDFMLYPESSSSFFSKERDLQFSFTDEPVRKLQIIEAGKLVAQASYSKQ